MRNNIFRKVFRVLQYLHLIGATLVILLKPQTEELTANRG